MYKLDIYIQNKIYNYYWQREFYNNIIIIFKNTDNQINNFVSFIKRYILPNNINNGIKVYSYYLMKYNNELENICNNIAMLLYFQKKYPFLYNLKNNIETYKKITPKFSLVLIYILTNYGSMRYDIIEKFKRLEIECNY